MAADPNFTTGSCGADELIKPKGAVGPMLPNTDVNPPTADDVTELDVETFDREVKQRDGIATGSCGADLNEPKDAV